MFLTLTCLLARRLAAISSIKHEKIHLQLQAVEPHTTHANTRLLFDFLPAHNTHCAMHVQFRTHLTFSYAYPPSISPHPLDMNPLTESKRTHIPLRLCRPPEVEAREQQLWWEGTGGIRSGHQGIDGMVYACEQA